MIEEFVRQAGPGIWTDKINQLKEYRTKSTSLRDDRAWLKEQLMRVLERGNKGKVCNLLLLALLIDRTYFEKWLRKSGCQRASRYDLNPSIPMLLCQELLKHALSLDLTAETITYLENIQRLLQIAPAVQALNVKIVRELFADKSAVKGLLITLDLTFLIRSRIEQIRFRRLHSGNACRGIFLLTFFIRAPCWSSTGRYR
jgi:hypothetical protein